MKVSIDKERCIGCRTCEVICPACFKMEENIAKVISESCDSCDIKEVAKSCPVAAIIVEEEETV